MGEAMSEVREEPPVQVFLFSVPIIGVGIDSDSALCNALRRLVSEPESVVRGDIEYSAIEDEELCQEELGKALASAVSRMVPVDTGAVA